MMIQVNRVGWLCNPRPGYRFDRLQIPVPTRDSWAVCSVVAGNAGGWGRTGHRGLPRAWLAWLKAMLRAAGDHWYSFIQRVSIQSVCVWVYLHVSAHMLLPLFSKYILCIFHVLDSVLGADDIMSKTDMLPFILELFILYSTWCT